VRAHNPPRLAELLTELLLRRFVGHGVDGESIVGDLHEEFLEVSREKGLFRARLWYLMHAVSTVAIYARPGRPALDRRLQDLRVALRGLRREPGFTAAVVGTLALAIGAGTAIFSVVDGVLLRPLPFDEPGELVRVWASDTQAGDPFVDLTYQDIDAFRTGTPSFTAVSALSEAPRVLLDERGENPEPVTVARSTEDLFATLGVSPTPGRAYSAEDVQNGDRLIVISHALWQRRFAGESDVIGRMVHLDVTGYEIIGVLPQGIAYPAGTDVWRALTPPEMEDDDREVHLLARLTDRDLATTANTEVAAVATRLAEATPETHAGLSAWLQPLQATVVKDVRAALYTLLGAVGLVLLIACANTANLLLARSAPRSHEVAIRTALGASRTRVVALHLTESLLLAALGLLAGLFVGRWALSFMLTLAPELPRLDTVVLDRRVILVMTSVTALAGILFGVGPALHAASAPPERTLREGGHTTTQSGRRLRLQSGLVTTEIALSTVLAVVALLLFSTFRTALSFDRGFEFDHMVAVTIDPMHPPTDGDEARAYFESLRESVARLGGVRDAALSSHAILEPRGYRVPVSVEGAPVVIPTPEAYINIVSPGFFATAGIPILQGEFYSRGGGVTGDAELIVNQRFAQLHLTETDAALGSRVTLDWVSGHVVGIARDVQPTLGEPALPKVYVSMERVTAPGVSLTVRTIADPAQVVPSIRRAIAEVDGNILIEDVAVVEQSLRSAVAPERFNMLLVICFAVMALSLAAVGIYGVTAISVSSRRGEIGIRRALGAGDACVAYGIARRIGALTAIGVALGLGGAALSSRLLGGLIVGVSPTDPAILAAVAIVLAGTAGVAALVPVRRALRFDPTESLRTR